MSASETARAPLTSRQFRFWLWYLNSPAAERQFMHVVVIVDLPHGTTHDRLGDIVEQTVTRHPVLRTRFAETEDGQYVQLVDTAARPELHQVELARPARDRGDLTGEAEELVSRPLDLSGQWPLRALAITVAGRLRQLCLMVHHVALDREALAMLRAQLQQALAADGPAPPPADTTPPTRPEDQDDDERARRRSDQALTHWSATLPTMPAVVLPYRRDTEGDLQHLVRVDSPTAAHAITRLQQATGLSASGIVLSAFDLALTAWTGLHRWRWETVVDNRPRTLPPGTLGCYMDYTLVETRTTAEHSFAHHAAQASRGLLRAVRHSVCDSARLLEIETSSSLTRGALLDAPLMYNFKALDQPAPTAATPTPPTRQAFRPSETHWSRRHDPALLFARVYRDGDVVTLSLAARSGLMPRQDQERVIHAVERILWSAAADPDTRADALCASVAAPHWPRKPDWTQLSGHRWADLPGTEAFLARTPGIRAAHCTVQDRNGSRALVAHLDTDRPTPHLTELNRRVREMMATPGLQAPDLFVLGTPDGTRTTHTWQDVATTPSSPPRHPSSEPEHALTALLRRIGGHDTPDLDRSHIEQGGRATDLIRAHRALEAAGWSGVGARDLLGPTTLGDLAARLRRTPGEAS